MLCSAMDSPGTRPVHYPYQPQGTCYYVSAVTVDSPGALVLSWASESTICSKVSICSLLVPPTHQ